MTETCNPGWIWKLHQHMLGSLLFRFSYLLPDPKKIDGSQAPPTTKAFAAALAERIKDRSRAKRLQGKNGLISSGNYPPWKLTCPLKNDGKMNPIWRWHIFLKWVETQPPTIK